MCFVFTKQWKMWFNFKFKKTAIHPKEIIKKWVSSMFVWIFLFVCFYKNEKLERTVSENWLNKTRSREWSTLQILKSCCIKYLFQWGNTCGIGTNGNVGYEMEYTLWSQFCKVFIFILWEKIREDSKQQYVLRWVWLSSLGSDAFSFLLPTKCN